MRSLLQRLTRALGAGVLIVGVVIAALPVRDATAGYGDVSIEEIDRAKRGKEHIRVRADVGDKGLTCQLKVKYPDGNADSPEDVVSNSKGICEIYFDVPGRRSVVGEAIAKLTVLNKKGKEVGKTSRWFTVRDRRG